MRMRLLASPLATASLVVVWSVAPATAQMVAQPPAYYHPPHYQQPQYYPPSYPAPVQPYPSPAYYPQYQSSCCCPVAKRGLFTSLSPCGYGVAYPQYPQYPAYAPYPPYPVYPQYQPYPYQPQYQAYPQYSAYPPATVYPQPRLKVRYKVRKRIGYRTSRVPPPRSPYVYGPWGTR